MRQAMASCAGAVVSASRGAPVDDYVSALIDMYNERGAEDAAVRLCVGMAFKECMMHAADVMRDHYSTVSRSMPFSHHCNAITSHSRRHDKSLATP